MHNYEINVNCKYTMYDQSLNYLFEDDCVCVTDVCELKKWFINFLNLLDFVVW